MKDEDKNNDCHKDLDTLSLPPISIITIVYNDIAHIKQTMDSVINQDYPQLEYIIIDGASSDGTKECIESHISQLCEITYKDEGRFYLEAKHRQKDMTFKFLSQKDKGIYDAMNKGIDLASGEWCNFMNCGDRFYTSSTISELFKTFFNKIIERGGGDKSKDIGVIYGDTHIIYDDTHSKILYTQDTSHKYHHRFVHQSAFIATSLMKAFKYDTSFSIAGDTDFFTKAYNAKYPFVYVPVIVSSFETIGLSSKLSFLMFKEDCIIGYKYNRLFPLYLSAKYLFYIIPRVCIRNIIPTRFRNRARILLGKKYS